MRFRISILFFLIIFISFFKLKAQTLSTIDSLLIELTRSKNDSLKISLMINAGEYYHLADVQKSIHLYNKALKLAESNHLLNEQSLILTHLAKIYQNSNYEIAQNYLVRAFEIAVIIENSRVLANVYTQFGIIKMNLKRNAQAKEYFEKALRLYEDVSDTIGISANLHNLGIIHFRNQDSHKAKSYISHALMLNERINKDEFLCKNYQLLSEMAMQTDSINLAFDYYNKSLMIAKTNNMYAISQSLYCWKTDYFLKSEQFDSVIFYATLVLEFDGKSLESHCIQNAYYALYQAYYKCNNFDNALLFCEKYYTFKDSISKFQHSQTIDLLAIDIESRGTNQLSGLKEDNKDLKRFNYILLVSSGVLLLNLIIFKRKAISEVLTPVWGKIRLF
ncbi:MAG: tetratricopeptide repeat protein [Bacteroidales bacterium]|nr:tetratricopeptide repeat protein [Bacteroidales bacterium]